MIVLFEFNSFSSAVKAVDILLKSIHLKRIALSFWQENKFIVFIESSISQIEEGKNILSDINTISDSLSDSELINNPAFDVPDFLGEILLDYENKDIIKNEKKIIEKKSIEANQRKELQTNLFSDTEQNTSVLGIDKEESRKIFKETENLNSIYKLNTEESENKDKTENKLTEQSEKFNPENKILSAVFIDENTTLELNDLLNLSVVKLRKLARTTKNFPIKGREISKANKEVLLNYFKKLN